MVLADLECVACNASSEAPSASERAEFLRETPKWQVVQVNGVSRLTRRYEFENFRKAMAFANQVGEVAEAENHHPELLTEWGACSVSWWTHSIGGLHRNDFILAARSDHLYTR